MGELQYIYHGTNLEFFDSIKEHGLDNNRGDRTNSTQFQGLGLPLCVGRVTGSTRYEDAEEYAKQHPIGMVLRWKVKKKYSTTGYSYCKFDEPVRSDQLELTIDGGKNWVKLLEFELSEIMEQKQFEKFVLEILRSKVIGTLSLLQLYGQSIGDQEKFSRSLQETTSIDNLCTLLEQILPKDIVEILRSSAESCRQTGVTSSNFWKLINLFNAKAEEVFDLFFQEKMYSLQATGLAWLVSTSTKLSTYVKGKWYHNSKFFRRFDGRNHILEVKRINDDLKWTLELIETAKKPQEDAKQIIKRLSDMGFIENKTSEQEKFLNPTILSYFIQKVLPYKAQTIFEDRLCAIKLKNPMSGSLAEIMSHLSGRCLAEVASQRKQHLQQYLLQG